jgi:AcrR family transcriptional regulator
VTKLTAGQAAATRERILTAAFTLFGRYGFKRTSMEDIASEAGLSRAGLYLQFRNKEDIFRELAGGLHEEALSGAEAALSSDQPLENRLHAAVEAKTLRMIEIIHASPHGSELVDEKNRLCGDLAVDSELRFQRMLARAFKRADEGHQIDLRDPALTATQAAELFAVAVSGLKGAETTADVYKKRLALFVRLFVIGLGGDPPERL